MNRKKLLLIAVLMVGVLVFVACGDNGDDNGAGNGEDNGGMYADGSYVGTAEGYGGEMELEVTVENDEITNVEILSHSETEGLGDEAVQEVIDQAIGQQNTDGVDTVSEATVSSEAAIEAINDALSQAEN